MRAIFLMVAASVVLMGCHNYSANVGEQLGCTIAGNGCDGDAERGDIGPAGPQGERGEVGPEGPAGVSGASCTILPHGPSHVRLVCPDGTEAVLVAPRGRNK